MINLEEMDIFKSVVLSEVKRKEGHHPMLCFDHGGGPRANLYNSCLNFDCPKCEEENE